MAFLLHIPRFFSLKSRFTDKKGPHGGGTFYILINIYIFVCGYARTFFTATTAAVATARVAMAKRITEALMPVLEISVVVVVTAVAVTGT